MVRIFCLFVMLACASVKPVNSQDICSEPSFLYPKDSPNILSERQEYDFGEAFAQQIQSEFLVIEEEIAENVRRIGQRLVAQAPPSKLHFQFILIDFPEVNAFCLPGGRVYIPRKLVAACQNEDELAGVLAHEIGHLLTRHAAIDLTRMLKKVLKISEISDGDDLSEIYNQLLDNIARNPGALKAASRYDQKEEITADSISVYLMKKAGYSPDAYIRLWDRILEVEGKTGGFLSDFLRTTKPEQKRLREMQRVAEQLPDACAGPGSSTTAQQFEEWKTAVIEYSGLGHRESLPAVERQRVLQPKLRGNIRHIRFSRDGQYLLAQDSSSIFVLQHQPFKVLFRIDAQHARAAQFTPDSQSIVFNTSSLRVEKWNLAERRRSSVQEMAFIYDCLHDKLSPDALHLACFDTDYRLTLFNVADGTKVFHKDFSDMAFSTLLSQLIALLGGSSFRMEFSPDGRYFIGADFNGDEHIAYDFVENRSIKLPRAIRDRLEISFGFMNDNRFIGVKGKKGEKSAIISFPTGEVLHTIQVNASHLTPTTRGDYLIIRPFQQFPAGIMDLTQNKVLMGSKNRAVDFFDKTFASEGSDGVLGLFNMDKNEATGQAILPESPLPQPIAVSLSSDQNWLAVSENSRGAIWDLRTGSRTFLARSFQAAHFTHDNTLIVDFPEWDKEKRMIVHINPAGPSVESSMRIEKDRVIAQEGLYLVEKKEPENKKNKPKTLLSVTNSATGQELWNRDYPDGFPWVNFNSEEDRAIFLWGASSDFVKKESKKDPDLKKKIRSSRERQGDYYIQILRASTGDVLHTLYIETGRGSFRFLWAELAGDHLTLYDNQNRLLIYSISSGKRLGQTFGVNGSLSPTMPLLAVENKTGVITVYSLPSMEERTKLKFSCPLVYVKFSGDGKHLFALTNDQTTYLFQTEDILAGQEVAEDTLPATSRM